VLTVTKLIGRPRGVKKRRLVEWGWREVFFYSTQKNRWSPLTMSLEVIVSKAVNLPNVERFGKIDPYVSVEFKGEKNPQRIALASWIFIHITNYLAPSTPAVPDCCRSMGLAPYWSNPSFFNFWHSGLWRSVVSARALNVKN